MNRRIAQFFVLLLPLFAGACAEAQFVIQGAKEISGSAGQQAAKSQGQYKIGNPYRIQETWYYPAEDFSYAETGIASWYGPGFHGKQTANGGIYNMNELTAAHRTLPMPSVVRVINLENGRSLMLTVNDRGPFARGRIIDVSRRAAQLLGFERQGTARVRVEILPEESQRVKLLALNGQNPPPSTPASPQVVAQRSVEVRPAQPRPPKDIVVTQGIVTASAGAESSQAEPIVQQTAVPAISDIFVQAGAFADPSNAARVQARLTPYGTAQVQEMQVGQQRLFRVRLGPIDKVEAADVVLSRVIDAGFPNARIVVD